MSLVKINIELIKIICRLLKIEFIPVFAGELETKGTRSNRIIDILNKLFNFP